MPYWLLSPVDKSVYNRCRIICTAVPSPTPKNRISDAYYSSGLQSHSLRVLLWVSWTNCNALSSEFCAVINTTVHAFSSCMHLNSILQLQSLQAGCSHSSNPRLRNLVQQENCPRHFTCGLHRWSILPLINISCLTVNSAHCNCCLLHHRSHDKRGLYLYVKSASLYLTPPSNVMH